MGKKKFTPHRLDNDNDINIGCDFTNIEMVERRFEFSCKQKELISLIKDPETKAVFISGPAGTAKTYIAVYASLLMMKNNKSLDMLYIRSPIESADKAMGSLPGDIGEKFSPYTAPLDDKLYEILRPSIVSQLKEGKYPRIDSTPVNYLRGANWRDKLVVADESQNFSFKEFTTLMTRVGENTKMIICGDPMQSDIGRKSAFDKVFDAFRDRESVENGIHCFEFDEYDIVRSDFVRFVIKKLGEALDVV